MLKYIKNKLLAITVLMILASFIGGALAVFLFSALDISGLNYLSTTAFDNRPITIISPGKVTLKLDVAIGNLAADTTKRFANIYIKKSKSSRGFNAVYTDDEIMGGAVAVTSDGWFMTADKITKGVNVAHIPAFNNGNIYEIERVIKDTYSDINFFKVALDKDIWVVSFSDPSGWQIGQSVIGLIRGSEAVLGTLRTLKDRVDRNTLIESSERPFKDFKVIFNSDVDNERMYVYDLSGRLMALADREGKYFYTDWQQVLTSVLRNQEIVRPFLGVNYVLLDNIVGKSLAIDPGRHSGALLIGNSGKTAVLKDSPAQSAGLVEGEIIIAVENDIVDRGHPLNTLINEYQPGDAINLTVIGKNGIEKNVSVILGEY